MTDNERLTVRGPAAWRPADMAASDTWIHPLSTSEVNEIETALAHAQSRAVDAQTMVRADFPLPVLAQRIARIRDDLVTGCGVALMRGLPVHRWTDAESLIVYAGIGTHLGDLTAQNAAGRVLDHVRATGRDWDKDPTVRGYQTTAALPFHCDKGDIVGLLCLRQGKSGGESCIASSVSIHNAAITRRPDLVETLYAPMYIDLRGEEPTGMKPYFPQPMFCNHKGRLFGRTGSKYAESAQRYAEVPRMTAQQFEAMEYIEALAQSDEFRFDMVFQPGDVQLLNNHVIFHSRRRYEDHPEPARWRHLVRMLMFTDAYQDVPDYIGHINTVIRWWKANPRAPGVPVLPVD